jgi:hypothetical protein
MSLLTDILDRLSGVAVVRERLAETALRVDRLADHVLDHERRLARLETLVLEPRPEGARALRRPRR